MRGAGITSGFRIVEVDAAPARIVFRIVHGVINEQTVIICRGFHPVLSKQRINIKHLLIDVLR